MDLTFYGAGSVVKPIDYHAEMNEFEHMRILAKQEGKLLNCTNVRVTISNITSTYLMPPHI